MKWYLKVLKQYADFNGRATRREYWMFTLFNLIFVIVAAILDNILGLTIGEIPYGIIYLLYSFVLFIPALSVAVRRLHDVNKSGWMILIALIPIVGSIWLLVLLVTESDPGENQYGQNPLAIDSEEAAINESVGDTLILIAVIWMFLSRLFWTIIPKIDDNFISSEWFKPVGILLSIVWAFVPIGLAFAVKNKSKKIVLFVLGGIYLLYSLYETVTRYIELDAL